MRRTAVKAEQISLITILTSKKLRVRNYLLAEVQPDDYGTDEGREIRSRMDVLLRNGRDIGDLTAFREDPTLSDEAIEFLTTSRPNVQKAVSLPLSKAQGIAHRLHDYRKIRALYEGAQAITELCSQQYREETIQEAEEALLDTVKAIRESRDKRVTHLGRKRTLGDIKQWIKNKLRKEEGRFVSTGLVHLDQHLRGWQRGDLVVISAPRGGGKTALLLQMAINQFRSGLNVGIASLEMEIEILTDRLIANVSDTKYAQVRLREYAGIEEKKRIGRAWKDFEYETAQKHGNIFSTWELKDPHYQPENLELDLGPMGYDVIYVDYLSLFSSGKQDMWVAQKEHGRYLKQLAGRINPKTVIVLLTQLSDRERVKYGTGPEEDADYWLWWRYGDEESETGQVELRLGKARHARQGVIPAKFDLARMQIRTTGGLSTALSSYNENQQERKKRKTGGPRRDGRKIYKKQW